ncbi:MAG: hypothetical protein JNK95_10260 [Candidatus Competibacter sp.]|nr:hypothetical protein [Candidatus Competibacter sp.]
MTQTANPGRHAVGNGHTGNIVCCIVNPQPTGQTLHCDADMGLLTQQAALNEECC